MGEAPLELLGGMSEYAYVYHSQKSVSTVAVGVFLAGPG